ncbi:ABC transporter substrate-binding protein [Streptomyces sp. CA-106131]|uniref:ABC transporter substrate-binding protein n=1 Tax=Streptomyces sp. CA-106131 TaxID=3240045 RepID=UPI003D94DFF6
MSALVGGRRADRADRRLDTRKDNNPKQMKINCATLGVQMAFLRKKGAAAVAVIAAVFLLSACSVGNDDKSAEGGSTKVVVTVAPVVDTAPLYLAREQGLFEKAGLDVDIQIAPSTGARIPALIANTAQVGLIGTADVLQAASAGIPLRVIGETTITTNDPAADTGKVYVSAKSGITDPAQLNGKTVAVGGLGGGGELSLRAALDQSGADSSKVKFIEVPFDSMVSALQSGRVNAISSVAPFTDAAEAAGSKYLLSPGAISVPGAAQQIAVTTAKYSSDHTEVVKKFVDALNKATIYATAHPDAVRKILGTYTKTPADVAARMQLPAFDPAFSKDRLGKWAQLMEKYKFVKNDINVSKLVGEN